MRKDDFEKDLDDYLRTRNRARNVKDFITTILDKLKPQPKPDVELPEDIEVYGHHPTPESKPSTHDEPLNEQLLRTEMQAKDAVNDMKEIARISLKMIKDLPDDVLRTFKESPEFSRLKTILKKHDLIK